MAHAPWDDDEMLARVRQAVLPVMQKHSPVVAWIVDDKVFPNWEVTRWECRGSTVVKSVSTTVARRR